MVGVRQIALAAAMTLSACGCHGKKTATEPKRPSRTDATIEADAGTSANAVDAGAQPASKLTVTECNRLIDHIIDKIATVEHAKKEDPKYVPTKAQVEKIRTTLRAELGPACLKWPRPRYDCVLAATDRPSYAACAQPIAPIKAGGASSP